MLTLRSHGKASKIARRSRPLAKEDSELYSFNVTSISSFLAVDRYVFNFEVHLGVNKVFTTEAAWDW